MIKTFSDIYEKHRISNDTLDGVIKRLARSMGIHPEEVKFTSLQKEAFNTKGFWLSDKDSRHIILQGATSAGKTLVSEMAMLDTLKNGNKTIVLVPLRAMVRERWEHWKKDLGNQGKGDHVFASSADYQDHDGEIINGDYDVAVIVYEKFFVMLTQSKGKMLEGCGLLIVDELQMLNNQNRGPKLEIAVQKVLRKNTQSEVNTRIMCLTTCDCKVDYVKKWLTVDNTAQTSLNGPPILIRNGKRPTALDEYVIQLDGHYRMRHINGENDKSVSSDEPKEDSIKVPNYNKNAKLDEGKRTLLRNLIQNIYSENANAKVLVFVNSRRNTIDLAEYIASEKILPVTPLSPNLERINEYDNDEYQKKLKELLLSRIACHNAAMTTSLREFVEEMFEDENDPIRIVVATETLTIGMNMPVDVMILFDYKISRGRSRKDEEPLSSQEYKNYIGRAGRLGNKNASVGRSYLLVENSNELKKIWNDYVDCNVKEIESSLKGAAEKEQAPYYLSLFNDAVHGEGYTLEDLKKLWKESFSKSCDGRDIDMKKVFAELEKAGLCSKNDDEYDDDDDEKTYKSTDFGKMMAPYAFTLRTCKKIDRFFLHGGKKRRNGEWQKEIEKGQGGLPIEISSENINKYILDILYVICCTDEVKKVGQLSMPADKNNNARNAKEIVEMTLRRMVKKVELWEKSPLKHMASDEYDWKDETETKECIMRAIILWHWVNGDPIDVIRKETNFNKFMTLVAGDIARLAETSAYVLESFSHCLPGYKGGLKFVNIDSENVQNDIYKLSTRVNYGVPQELVKLANKHVHGLDRKVILDIGKFYKEVEDNYDDIFHMLREPSPEHKKNLNDIIKDEQRKELLKNVEESHTHETLNLLLENIIKESEVGNDTCVALENFYNTDSGDGSENLLESLGKIFKEMYKANDVKDYFFGDAIKIDYVIGENAARLVCTSKNFSNKERVVFIVAYFEAISDERASYKYQISKADRTILIINNNAKVGRIENSPDGTLTLLGKNNETILEGINSTMSFNHFGWLIAQTIMDGNKSASKLIDFLFDWHGEFNKPVKALPLLLKNYEKEIVELDLSKQNSLQPIRVLWDKHSYKYAVSDLRMELEKQKIPYRELYWGENLRDERALHNDECTLLMLSWETVKSSESLSFFCEGLKKNQYENVFAIFSSEDAYKNWGGDPENPCKSLKHVENTKNFDSDICEIKSFFENVQNQKFRVGISYAHEKKNNFDRTAVTLLNKFVEKITDVIPKETILYDNFHSYLFSGNGGRKTVLEKYSQCDYFIILDDEYYDLSEFCREERETIQKTLSKMKDSTQRLWCLHPKNANHSKIFNNNEDFSKDFGNEDDIDLIVKDFLHHIKAH